jgi:hypothetical protein
MRLKHLDLHQIAITRLASLGCENLPPQVRERIIKDFTTDAERKLQRLVKRQVTVPKIAKIFTASMQPQEGAFEGGVQPPPLNQSGLRNDAIGDMSQSL